MRHEIVTNKLSHGLACFDGSRSVVWLQEHIVEGEKPWIELRLTFEHVKGGGAQRAAFECIKQGIFIDIGSAGDIDQHPLPAESRNHLAADDVAGGGRSGQE